MPAYIISSDNEKNVQLVVYLAKGLGLDVADAPPAALPASTPHTHSPALNPVGEAGRGKRRIPRPGSISAAAAEDLQRQLTQVRDEWNRSC